MLKIDGSFGEGGGQILRSSLTLSMLTGTPFVMERIRGNRKKPGLMRQHLTAVLAAARISGAVVEGAVLNSDSLSFCPQKIQGGTYEFSIGTAGSIMLVLQTLLPALLAADTPSHLILEGGTHNQKAPPFDFIAESFLPHIRNMGAKVEMNLIRPGFFPAGGGKLEVHLQPLKEWQPMALLKRGDLLGRKLVIYNAHLPMHIARREIEQMREFYGISDKEVEIRPAPESRGPGNVMVSIWKYANGGQVMTSFGSHGCSAEQVGRTMNKLVKKHLKSQAPVCEFLADQLLLPMALAGDGSFITEGLSRHASTNLEVIALFLGRTGKVTKVELGELVSFG